MLYPIENIRRELKKLNGIWQFRREEEFEEGFKNKWYEKPLENTVEMPVPASYNDITVDKKVRDHVGWVWYEKEFAVPTRWMEDRLVLRFGSVTHHAVVYVNGIEVCRHKGGFLPFECEVSELVAPGTNRVTVAVSNLLDWTTLPIGEVREIKNHPYLEDGLEQWFSQDFFNYSGIHRPVVLYTTPKWYIRDIDIATDFKDTEGYVTYKIDTEGCEEQVQIRILNEQGEAVAEANGSSGTITIPNVILWEPGKAYLYDFEVNYGEDIYTLPIGIRTIQVTEKQFLINGKPFYFKGFGKHEDSDIRGKGLDEALNVRDFELLKWIGANSFRTSHYPYSEELMQMADRQGFVIIDEVPAVGMSIPLPVRQPAFLPGLVDEKTLEYHKQTLNELYQRDKNHPCVVMWSVANEPSSNEENAGKYFKEIAEHMRSLEKNRPITAVINALVEKDCMGQWFDVVCINRYYSWYEDTGKLEVIYPMMKKELATWWEKLHRPVMITEYGADTISGFHKLPEAIFTEEYQEEFIKENNRALDECDFCVGEHIWAFADFMTSFRIHRFDGNKKGIFTRQRQPKSAAYLVRKRWTSEIK